MFCHFGQQKRTEISLQTLDYWNLELHNFENIKLASNVEIDRIEHDIEDSFE